MNCYRYGDSPRWVTIRSPFGHVVYHVRNGCDGTFIGLTWWEA